VAGRFPDGVCCVDLKGAELPKTISGKIRWVDLRRGEERAAVGEAVTEYRDEHFPELKG